MSAGRFRLIVFDLDGTLIDSRRDLAAATNELLVECGPEPLPEEHVGRMVGSGAATLVARAFEARGIEKPDDALERFLRTYDRHLTDHTRPYDGIPEVLAVLRQRATLALLTNKPLGATRTILERLDLAGYFGDGLVSGGDGPLPRKPDAAGLRQLMTQTHTPPEATVLVGDSLIDWKTARAAQTSICMARYGFGFEGFPAEHLAHDDIAVDTPAGLVSL